ncbi:MAG: tyrosine-protein phosphatase [Solirubrobacteraceae bacterium]|nr:MAG: hypothetical protein DLM63_08235 [Solirubrobacterales bacterium]
MIDLHSHVLAGLDDGPAQVGGSIAMARVAAEEGTRRLVATPHVNETFHPQPSEIAIAVAALNVQLARSGIALDVVAGAELALTRLVELEDAVGEGYALGGGPWLLVESPYSPEAGDFDRVLVELARRGDRIVLAHPERCPTFQRDPARLRKLSDAGVLNQVTADSLGGRFGIEVRRFALTLLRDDLVHVIASDGHDHHNRPPRIAQALDAVAREVGGLDARWQWLTEAMPAAILAGDELPAAPAQVTRGTLRRFLRRR